MVEPGFYHLVEIGAGKHSSFECWTSTLGLEIQQTASRSASYLKILYSKNMSGGPGKEKEEILYQLYSVFRISESIIALRPSGRALWV